MTTSIMDRLNAIWQGGPPRMPEGDEWSATVPLGDGRRVTVRFRSLAASDQTRDQVVALSTMSGDLAAFRVQRMVAGRSDRGIGRIAAIMEATNDQRIAALRAFMLGWDVEWAPGDPVEITHVALADLPIDVFYALYAVLLRHLMAWQRVRWDAMVDRIAGDDDGS